jgi:hypothetical protein
VSYTAKELRDAEQDVGYLWEALSEACGEVAGPVEHDWDPEDLEDDDD